MMPPRRRAAVVTAAVAAVVLSAAAAAAYVAGHRTEKPKLTSQELAAYQGALIVPLREGGRVVEQDMKPTVTDFTQGTVTPAALSERSATWVDELTRVREQVAAVPAPDPLRPASAGFDRALARYVDAARGFGTAARATDRTAALDAAYTIANDADHLYDSASAVLQRVRRDLGLDPSSDFPDPQPTP
jgi:hypothetical protein